MKKKNENGQNSVSASANVNEISAIVERFINQLPSRCVSKEMFRIYKKRYEWLMANGLSKMPFKKQAEVGKLLSQLYASINN